MSNRSPAAQLWVDVGQLLRHEGRITGIQRTVSSILQEWLTQGVTFRLCAFSLVRQCYGEVSLQHLQSFIASLNTHTSAPRLTPQKTSEAETKRGVKKAVRALLRRLHPELKLACRDSLSCVRHLARFLNPLKSAADSPDRALPPTSHFSFGPGDVLLIPAGAWDDVGACECLRTIRQSCSLSVVPLIYDLIPLKIPQVCARGLPAAYRDWIEQLLGISDLMLGISEHTRRDLLDEARQRGWAAPPVEVIRLGDKLAEHVEPIRPHDLPACFNGPFALNVGTIEPRKNPELLYHLWRRLVQKHGSETPPLILAGRPGWLTADLMHFIEHDTLLQGKLLLLPDLTDPELRWLYENCLFTLYPSHYEGWGLPVAESLAHGKFCICSNASSLPEIAGDLVDYHDPLDLPGCLTLVERALFEPGFLEARQERVRRLFLVTPWQATAQQVLDALRRRLGSNPGNASLATALSARKVG
jgi:glycosyltransferase involved in cell wall biosynthesis